VKKTLVIVVFGLIVASVFYVSQEDDLKTAELNKGGEHTPSGNKVSGSPKGKKALGSVEKIAKKVADRNARHMFVSYKHFTLPLTPFLQT
jgi:hypothetical protein